MEVVNKCLNLNIVYLLMSKIKLMGNSRLKLETWSGLNPACLLLRYFFVLSSGGKEDLGLF
jgi:hypothetical protein